MTLHNKRLQMRMRALGAVVPITVSKCDGLQGSHAVYWRDFATGVEMLNVQSDQGSTTLMSIMGTSSTPQLDPL